MNSLLYKLCDVLEKSKSVKLDFSYDKIKSASLTVLDEFENLESKYNFIENDNKRCKRILAHSKMVLEENLGFLREAKIIKGEEEINGEEIEEKIKAASEFLASWKKEVKEREKTEEGRELILPKRKKEIKEEWEKRLSEIVKSLDSMSRRWANYRERIKKNRELVELRRAISELQKKLTEKEKEIAKEELRGGLGEFIESFRKEIDELNEGMEKAGISKLISQNGTEIKRIKTLSPGRLNEEEVEKALLELGLEVKKVVETMKKLKGIENRCKIIPYKLESFEVLEQLEWAKTLWGKLKASLLWLKEKVYSVLERIEGLKTTLSGVVEDLSRIKEEE